MRVSTKGRYGLRAMVDLATHAEDGKISLVHIAKRQNISLNYLEQVFAALRKAGLVKSVKGAAGGYLLASPPEDIKIEDILSVLEGKFNIIEENEVCRCQDNVQKAIKQLVWDPINEKVNEYIKTTRLADLVQQKEG